MELVYSLVSFVIGLILGGIVVYFYATNASKNQANKDQTAAELKSLLAVQARDHIDSSHSLISQIQKNTQQLQSQLSAYESSLSESEFQEDDSKSTFYGEHASVYLRNSIKTDKSETALANSDAQPRDFSNDASGLFAGANLSEEKPSK